MYVIVVVALVFYVLSKILNVNNRPEASAFFCANEKFLEQILKHAPRLSEPYVPTRLWGYSGHIQTICLSLIGRTQCSVADGERHMLKMQDGSTVSYDLYRPMDPDPDDGDVTLALAPGIGNSSESVYVKRVVFHARYQGYRVAVLNHVGALRCVPVSSPRVFGYGYTKDYSEMVEDLHRKYPETKFICVGFSMGGNIVTKYLGERKCHDKILAGISVCQGYDIVRSMNYLLMWESGRRLYYFAITENFKAILRHWQKELFGDGFKKSKNINERAVWAGGTLVDLDREYTRKVYGFASAEEMYREWSCASYWENIEIPMILINSTDDPIVPPQLVQLGKDISMRKSNFILIEQKYGGHLGFHQGGLIFPHALSWLDKIIIDLSYSLCIYVSNKSEKREIAKNGDYEPDALCTEASSSCGANCCCCKTKATVGKRRMDSENLASVEAAEKKIGGTFDLGFIGERIFGIKNKLSAEFLSDRQEPLLENKEEDQEAMEGSSEDFGHLEDKEKVAKRPKYVSGRKSTSHSK